MKRLFLALALATSFVAGCRTTGGIGDKTTERAEIRAVYRPVSDESEIAVTYSLVKD